MWHVKITYMTYSDGWLPTIPSSYKITEQPLNLNC